jgi:hypothetical protein
MLNPAIFSSLVSLSGNDWDYFKYHRHVGIGIFFYGKEKENVQSFSQDLGSGT